MADITTIQIRRKTKQKLDELKLSERDTYNDIIENLIEDSMELSEQTIKEIEEARLQVQRGERVSLAGVKRDLGL
jgi:predicted transcriptional regulator